MCRTFVENIEEAMEIIHSSLQVDTNLDIKSRLDIKMHIPEDQVNDSGIKCQNIYPSHGE